MTRMLAALAALLSILFASPVWAAIGNPVDLGTASATTGVTTTLSITLGSAVAAGDFVYVPVTSTNNTGVVSVTDSAGNAYRLEFANVAGNVIANGYAVLDSPLPSGGAITVTFAGTLGRKMASAASVTGVSAPTASAFDQTGLGVSGSDQFPTFTTGLLAQPSEIVFAATYVNMGATDEWHVASGWSSLAAPAVDGRVLRVSYRIVDSTAALTFNPDNTVSRAWTANFIAFKGAATNPAVRSRMLLLGVGE